MALLDGLFPSTSDGFPVDAYSRDEAERIKREAEMTQAADALAAAKFARQRGPQFGGGFPDIGVPPVGMLGSMPGMSMATAPGPAPTVPTGAPSDMAAMASAQPAPPPPTNDPLASVPQPFVNGVPAPPSGQADGPAPFSMAPPLDPNIDVAALPANATPTVGTGSPMQQPGQPPIVPPAAVPAPAAPAMTPAGAPAGPSILSRIFNPNHAATMLALGAGFSGAPSFGTGLSRASAAAVPAVAADRAFEQKQLGIADTYKALVAKGVSPQEALAAVNNPDIMKATAAKYFETKPMTVHNMKDALGNETPVVFDPNKGEFRDMSGKKISGDGAAGEGTAGHVNILAPGTKQYDATLPADQYMSQFGPEMQAAMKAWLNGDVMPTGNPRQAGIASAAKTYAQTYAQKAGIPASDADYSEKRKYRLELGSNGAATAGGQAKAFNQGMEHANGLADTLVRLGNYDPVGVTSVAHGVNWLRGFNTKQADIVNQAQTLGQTLAGEVGKLFSGSAGGGVHEREMTRDRFNTVASPSELAGALEGTMETMQGGLTALNQRRDQVLGPNNNVNFVTKETEARIAHIHDVIQKLRGMETSAQKAGGGSAQVAAPAAPAAPPAPGRYQWDPQGGLRPIQ